MFAFAFFDAVRGELFLGRDRLGIKPLFVTRTDRGIFFASEVKAFPFPLKTDPVRSLWAISSIGDHSNGYTVFKGIRHVAPGTYQRVDTRTLSATEHRYYCLTEQVEESNYMELDKCGWREIEDRFKSLLSCSVEKLMSDAPIGAFVSGGIDSSLVAALAAKMHPELALFSADVVGRLSEIDDARLLARSIGCDLHEQAFQASEFVEYLVDATWYYEAPIVTHTNAVPFMRVAQLARKHGVKCVLTGEGSDELFLGYPNLLTRRFRKLARSPVEFLERGYGLVPGLREYLFPKQEKSAEGFMEVLVQGFERQRMREQGIKAYDFLPPEKAMEQYLTIQMLREGIIALLHRNDRMGMAASIESRFPFLDEELLHFAVNLPVRFKIGRSGRFHNYKHPFLTDKAIVRRSAKTLLPEALVHKRKNGFPIFGHRHMKIQKGFFKNGFLGSIIDMDDEVEDFLLREQNRYSIAKLASVEVFGRLFEFGEDRGAVASHLRSHANVVTN
jgi:asparagine synthase (glutamine-hydrolysing)